MRIVIVMFGLGAALAAVPGLDRVPPVLAGSIAVACAVALAALALAEVRLDAVLAGAAAALVHAALSSVSPGLAGAAAVACIFVPRALRAPGAIGGALQVLVAGLAGGLAAAVLEAYFVAGVAATVQATAVGVASLVAVAPLLLAVDDGIAFTLRRAAGAASGATRRRLARALVLRRRDGAVMAGVSRPARKRIEAAWKEVARTAALRAQAPGRELEVLDRRLDLYLGALRRAQRAATAARALDAGLDARVLAALELERTDLEARAEALAQMSASETGGGPI